MGVRMPSRGPFSAGDEPEWLERYLSGECTAAESARIEHWVAADPANAATLAAARRVWEATGPLPQRFSPDAALRAIRQRAHATVPHTRPRGVGSGATGLRALIPALGARAARPQSLMATMVVVALGAGLVVGSLRHRGSLASPGRVYTTAAGQRLSVTLIDGTRLTLAPASRVRLSADYGQGMVGRELELEGEAYFAVVHDAAHPFAVRAHGAVARDVGTAFDVRAYPEDAGMRVAVAEGVVAIGGVEVRAGDVATAADGRAAVAHAVDVATLTTWRQGGLAFRDTPLTDVARDIARTFGLRVTIADSGLGTRPITATFGSESVDDVLDEVTHLVGARYERMGQRVVIRRRIGQAGAAHEPVSPQPLQTARAGPALP